MLTDRQVTVIEAPHDMFIRIRNKVYKSNISYRQVNRGANGASMTCHVRSCPRKLLLLG